jgi:YHS domain-containing protein
MRILVPALAVAMLAAACGASTPPRAAAPSTASASQTPLKAPGVAKIGDRTRCPVSGDVFTVTADSPHAEYQGKTYYFCCADCPNAFKKEPQKYVKGA